MRRALLAALVAVLLLTPSVMAASPSIATITPDAVAQYSVPLTFSITASTREAVWRDFWVRVECTTADGHWYNELAGIWDWTVDGRRAAHATAGPYVMASDVPLIQPGTVGGTSAGDWNGGPADVGPGSGAGPTAASHQSPTWSHSTLTARWPPSTRLMPLRCG